MKTHRPRNWVGLALAAALLMWATASEALALRQIAANRGAPGPGGVVNLPYMVNDSAGNMWRIYQGGWLPLTISCAPWL